MSRFLIIAGGSAGEVGSVLGFLERREGFARWQAPVYNLKSSAESCSRQLRAWADHLQNSDIKGHRHLKKKPRKIVYGYKADVFRNTDSRHRCPSPI